MCELPSVYSDQMVKAAKPDREFFLRKQRELCGSKGYPFFMPRDGYCGCGRDIVEGEMAEGNDGRILVTGCPFCHRSYCD